MYNWCAGLPQEQQQQAHAVVLPSDIQEFQQKAEKVLNCRQSAGVRRQRQDVRQPAQTRPPVDAVIVKHKQKKFTKTAWLPGWLLGMLHVCNCC
jgi:hypothetical protein